MFFIDGSILFHSYFCAGWTFCSYFSSNFVTQKNLYDFFYVIYNNSYDCSHGTNWSCDLCDPIIYSVQKAEAATSGVLREKAFLEISQNSQENTCAMLGPATLLKKRLWHRCFPVNFVKFLRTPFLQNTSGRLLFKREVSHSKRSKIERKYSTKESNDSIAWVSHYFYILRRKNNE